MSTWRYVLGVTLYALTSAVTALLVIVGLVGGAVTVGLWFAGAGQR